MDALANEPGGLTGHGEGLLIGDHRWEGGADGGHGLGGDGHGAEVALELARARRWGARPGCPGRSWISLPVPALSAEGCRAWLGLVQTFGAYSFAT